MVACLRLISFPGRLAAPLRPFGLCPHAGTFQPPSPTASHPEQRGPRLPAFINVWDGMPGEWQRHGGRLLATALVLLACASRAGGDAALQQAQSISIGYGTLKVRQRAGRQPDSCLCSRYPVGAAAGARGHRSRSRLPRCAWPHLGAPPAAGGATPRRDRAQPPRPGPGAYYGRPTPRACRPPPQEEWHGEVIRLSWKPRAFLFKKFLSEEECDHLVRMVGRQGARLAGTEASRGPAGSGARDRDPMRRGAGSRGPRKQGSARRSRAAAAGRRAARARPAHVEIRACSIPAAT
jgi:hypothetical protein